MAPTPSVSRRCALAGLVGGALVLPGTRSLQAQGGEISQVVNWVDGGELLLLYGDRVLLQDVIVPTAIVLSPAGRNFMVGVMSRITPQVVGRNVRVFPFTTVLANQQRRKLAQVYLEGGKWLQHELVARGAAWVMPTPGSMEHLPALYEAEHEARTRRVGLWGSGDFQVHSIFASHLITGRSYILFGRIGSLRPRAGDWLIAFDPAPGESVKKDSPPPRVLVVSRAVAAITQAGQQLSVGQSIRVRGWLSGVGGRQIVVQNAAQIETLS